MNRAAAPRVQRGLVRLALVVLLCYAGGRRGDRLLAGPPGAGPDRGSGQPARGCPARRSARPDPGCPRHGPRPGRDGRRRARAAVSGRRRGTGGGLLEPDAGRLGPRAVVRRAAGRPDRHLAGGCPAAQVRRLDGHAARRRDVPGHAPAGRRGQAAGHSRRAPSWPSSPRPAGSWRSPAAPRSTPPRSSHRAPERPTWPACRRPAMPRPCSIGRRRATTRRARSSRW